MGMFDNINKIRELKKINRWDQCNGVYKYKQRQ